MDFLKMMMKKLIFIGLLLPLTVPAFAAGKPTKQAGDTPAVRPVYETDGSFGFCIADHVYPDGRKITFAFSPQSQINVGVTIPKGGFRIGSKYDIFYVVSEEEPRKVRAGALDEETLLLQMGSNATFHKKLAASTTFKVGKEGNMVSFALPAMPALLDNLKKCVTEKAKTRNEAAAKAEQALPETLKALLVTAGLTDITPMTMDNIPPEKRPADFIWQIGNILGGVRERVAPEDKTLSDLIGIHMQGLKNKCTGKYRAEIGREQKEGGLNLRIAEASCSPNGKDSEKAVFVAILFYLTKAGQFAVFTHEGLMEYKNEAITARDKLAKTLLTLTKP